MTTRFFSLGAASAVLAVACGAFAAHGLRARLDAEHLELWQTAARYQMYHALALLATAWLATQPWARPRLVVAAGWLFVAGTLLFSGSLYALALGGPQGAGLLTPMGGVAWLAGWGCLAVAGWRRGDRGD